MPSTSRYVPARRGSPARGGGPTPSKRAPTPLAIRATIGAGPEGGGRRSHKEMEASTNTRMAAAASAGRRIAGNENQDGRGARTIAASDMSRPRSSFRNCSRMTGRSRTGGRRSFMPAPRETE